MIVNPSSIAVKFKCGKKLAHYLQYECHLPLLGIEGDSYYFAKTDALEQALNKVPWPVRISELVK